MRHGRSERRQETRFARVSLAVCRLTGSLVLLGLACGGNAVSPGARLESNTNWLRSCESDADCSGDFSCLCNMCSLPCEESAACGALAGALCSLSCSAAPVAGMCVLGCSSSSDCEGGFVCVDSECRPATVGAGVAATPTEPREAGSEAGEASLPSLGDRELSTPGPCANAFISTDSVYALALADMMEQPEAAQPFTRYVSLANRVNAGACPPDLEMLRSGVTLALNSTSRAIDFGAPRPIDSGSVLYRIDLRDYTWDRPVSVSGIEVDDGWDAVIASTPFAVELVGPEADELKARTGAVVPILPADTLTSTVIDAETYKALLKLPETLDALFGALEVDSQSNRQSGAAQRAGTSNSLLSRRDRILERQPMAPGKPGVWLTFEFTSEDLPSSLFEEPIGMSAAVGGSVIFPLPNGLPGYALFDAEERLAAISDLLLDFNMEDFQVRAAVSCMSCHVSGVLEAEDEVREWVQAAPDLFDATQRSAVEMLYPPASDWAALSSADSALYQEAKLRLGVSLSVDPAARVFIAFNNDLTTADQAGDLMLSQTVATTELVGAGEAVDRNDFGVSFLEKSCAALASARNAPRDCALP